MTGFFDFEWLSRYNKKIDKHWQDNYENSALKKADESLMAEVPENTKPTLPKTETKPTKTPKKKKPKKETE